ncbi:MAG: type II secretion system F family protein, partial [Acidobacteria bacterium]
TEGTNNLVFQNELARAREGMMAGDGIADPIIESGLFPSTISQMIRVGEETGTLDEQLMNAAVFLEDELSYSLEKLTAWFEPLTIVFIGIMVGFVALALVSAMYGIYNQVEI